MVEKQFKNLNEQIEIFKHKGLIINDEKYTKQVLLRENYFFLNGYRHLLVNAEDRQFRDGTTFEEALKDGSRTKYTYAAELANIRIYRSGVDVTDCYDIKIEKTNNS